MFGFIGFVPVPLLSETTTSGVLLAGSFVLLLLGAEIFTNGVEWLGQYLGLGNSATGSVLAAVGTALPETLIPVIALVGAFLSGKGSEAASEIGVGAILGAPFLLATIAMFLVGVSVIAYSGRREHGRDFHVNDESTERDLFFFFVGYVLAVVAAFVPGWAGILIGIFLVAWYCLYLYRTIKNDDMPGDDEELDPLYLGRLVERLGGGSGGHSVPDGGEHAEDTRTPSGGRGVADRSESVGTGYGQDPPGWAVGLQTLIALAVIIGGAHLFVTEIRFFSNEVFAIPAAILSLLLAPFATELPEKFNSILWISDDKDTLALGNITGAMAFQGTLPVTIGILFTSWDLSLQWGTTGFLNIFSAVLALMSAGILYFRARTDDSGTMRPGPFLIGGAFYVLFIAVVLYHVFVLGL